MSEEIEPALTPAEWEELGPKLTMDDRAEEITKFVNGPDAPRFLGAAALALADQPFGFTWEDVDLLRAVPKELVSSSRAGWRTNLADRVASLLPPRA